MDDIEDMAKASHAGFHPRELRSAVAFSSRKKLPKQQSPSAAVLESSVTPPRVPASAVKQSSGAGIPGVEVRLPLSAFITIPAPVISFFFQ